MFAVSNEDSAAQVEMRKSEKLGPTFVFLSDPDAKLAAIYAGKQESHHSLWPATFVIDKHRKIGFAFVSEGHGDSPPPSDLLKAVQAFKSAK